MNSEITIHYMDGTSETREMTDDEMATMIPPLGYHHDEPAPVDEPVTDEPPALEEEAGEA